MKIQGPNPLINIYKQNHSKIIKANKDIKQTDKIDISFEAKKLQENGVGSLDRATKIAEIKQLVQNDEYEVNYDQTARGMIDFLTN